MHISFVTSILAYMLDSLVRVSRRVSKNHFGNIIKPLRAMIPQASAPLSTALSVQAQNFDRSDSGTHNFMLPFTNEMSA